MHIMPGSRSSWSGLPGSSGSDRERRDLDLGVGAVELRAGLEEPDDVERGRRQRPAPGRLVLLRRRLLAGLGAEQLVVAEVFREPELQQEHAVLAQPGADVRAVHHDVDAGGPQRVRGTDAGELEDLGRGDGARREDHLAGGAGLDGLSVLAPPHADRPAALEQHPIDDRVQRDGQVGTVHDRVEERVGRADTAGRRGSSPSRSRCVPRRSR